MYKNAFFVATLAVLLSCAAANVYKSRDDCLEECSVNSTGSHELCNKKHIPDECSNDCGDACPDGLNPEILSCDECTCKGENTMCKKRCQYAGKCDDLYQCEKKCEEDWTKSCKRMVCDNTIFDGRVSADSA